MDGQFHEWAKQKFFEMKTIDAPDRTAISMVKGIMESEQPDSVKLARIEAVIKAFGESKI